MSKPFIPFDSNTDQWIAASQKDIVTTLKDHKRKKNGDSQTKIWTET